MAQYYAEDGYPFVPAEARAALARFLGDASLGCMWVFVADLEMVGYVALTLGYSLELPRPRRVRRRAVSRPGSSRRGARLAGAGVCRGRVPPARVRALHLEAERRKPRLLAFYGRAGFVAHDRHLMTKPIGSADAQRIPSYASPGRNSVARAATSSPGRLASSGRRRSRVRGPQPRLVAREAGERSRGNADPAATQLLDELVAVLPGHREIGQQHVDVPPAEGVACGGRRVDRLHVGAVAPSTAAIASRAL